MRRYTEYIYENSMRVTPTSPFCTAYRIFLASRTAYRLTTKTTMCGASIYINKIKWQYVACTCTIILANVSEAGVDFIVLLTLYVTYFVFRNTLWTCVRYTWIFYVLRTNLLPTAHRLKILNTAYQRGEGVTLIASSVVIIGFTYFTIYVNVCGCTLYRPVTYR